MEQEQEINLNYLATDDGSIYMVDFEKLIIYIGQSYNDKLSETTITELYHVENSNRMSKGDNLKLVQKQVDERKVDSGQVKAVDDLRRHFITPFLENVLNIGFEQQEQGKIKKNNSTDVMSVSEIISFNTLLHLGIIVKLN
jgi:hypothetical protein